MDRHEMMTGAVVMYQPDNAEREVPHLVIAISGDLMCVKPLHEVTRDMHGSTWVARMQCRPLHVVRSVSRPVLELNAKQVYFVHKACDFLADAVHDGKVEPEPDELCALHNIQVLLDEYVRKRKGIK